MKKITLKLSALLLMVSSALLSPDSKAQTLPAGFSRVKLTLDGELQSPADLDFAPDGRIFIAEKDGKVKVFKNGAILATPFITLAPENTLERGLSGIVLDPAFSTNGLVYLYYTAKSPVIQNRLVRVKANGDVADMSTLVTLFNVEEAESEFHHAGGMVFGNDGKLYIGIGEDHHPTYAQDLNMFKGKILRMNADGTPAPGNPFTTPEKAKYIWTYGHRNPYSLSKDPVSGKIFDSEVGEFSWEEVNNVSTAGKNFGWPNAEGMNTDPSYVNPIYTYRNYKEGKDDQGEGCAITGGTFLGPNSNYPSQYQGKFFLVDFCLGWIRYVDPNTGAKTDFASNFGAGLIRIKSGPDGNLYHVGTADQQGLFKIVYSQTAAPEILKQPSSVTTSEQEPATFTVSANGAAPLAYRWMKNGVTISGATAASYTIPHVAPGDAGTYTVEVSNGSGKVVSTGATLTVTAFNARPVATITAPGSGLYYKGGDVFNYTGTASDPEDGVLPANAYTWQVDFHHADHIHPGGAVSGATSGSITIPKTGEVSADVFFRINLTVKDSKGLVDSAYVDIYPTTSTITITTDPAGLQITWDGQPHATPYTVTAVVGMDIAMGVISPQLGNGTTHNFQNWIDGGTPTHTVNISPVNSSYAAKFNTVTGISEADGNDKIGVNVYPNPNQGTFKVEVNLDPANKERIYMEVISSIGQLMFMKVLEPTKNAFIETLQLDNIVPSGIYTVKIRVGDKAKNTRIALMK